MLYGTLMHILIYSIPQIRQYVILQFPEIFVEETYDAAFSHWVYHLGMFGL